MPTTYKLEKPLKDIERYGEGSTLHDSPEGVYDIRILNCKEGDHRLTDGGVKYFWCRIFGLIYGERSDQTWADAQGWERPEGPITIPFDFFVAMEENPKTGELMLSADNKKLATLGALSVDKDGNGMDMESTAMVFSKEGKKGTFLGRHIGISVEHNRYVGEDGLERIGYKLVRFLKPLSPESSQNIPADTPSASANADADFDDDVPF